MKKTILAFFLLATMFCFTAKAAPKPLDAAVFEQPALITAVGQSADAQMTNVLFKRNNLRFTLSNMAKPDDLAGVKTLVLVIGGSSKGLGAAGINAEQEAKRTAALIDAAKAAGIRIMALHIGGESRRGDLTDRYIPLCTGPAEYAIIVESGDADKVFAKAMEGKFLDYAKNVGSVAPLIKKAFK
jgi:hypothetical protein